MTNMNAKEKMKCLNAVGITRKMLSELVVFLGSDLPDNLDINEFYSLISTILEELP